MGAELGDVGGRTRVICLFTERSWTRPGFHWEMNNSAGRAQSETGKRNSPSFWDDRAPVSFPHWSAVLDNTEIPVATQGDCRRAILGFLRHCKSLKCPASIAV